MESIEGAEGAQGAQGAGNTPIILMCIHDGHTKNQIILDSAKQVAPKFDYQCSAEKMFSQILIQFKSWINFNNFNRISVMELFFEYNQTDWRRRIIWLEHFHPIS